MITSARSVVINCYAIITQILRNFMRQAYGSGAMSKVNVYKRFKEFKEGRADYRGQRGANQNQKTLRNEANIAKIRELIAEDARSTISELAIETGLGKTTVRQILSKDLGFTKKCARSVSPLRKFKQILRNRDATFMQLLRKFYAQVGPAPFE